MWASTQVSGAGQRRGCRNPGTKTCPSLSSIVPSGNHPSCSFPPQLDGPAASPRDLFFLRLPQENLMAVFSKLFPLKTSYAQRFEYWKATSLLDPFEVFSLWWAEECKLGVTLAEPSEVVHNKMGALKSDFWVQRSVMLVLVKKKRAHGRIRQPVACVNRVLLPLLPFWCDDVSTGLPVNLEAQCPCRYAAPSPCYSPCCRHLSRAPSEVWLCSVVMETRCMCVAR